MSTVANAVAELRRGRPIIVVDDSGIARMVIDAGTATAEGAAMLTRHGSGVVCAVMSADALDALDLPAQPTHQHRGGNPDYAITVDFIAGVTTGICAADRATTLRGLAEPRATAGQFCRPGHIMPVRATAGGVLSRRDGFHAALDLNLLAECSRCVGVDTLIDSWGDLLGGVELTRFAEERGIPVVTVAQVVQARRESAPLVFLRESGLLTVAGQLFDTHTFVAAFDKTEHAVLSLGFLGNLPLDLVRTHTHCWTGAMPLGSSCSCNQKLQDSLAAVAAAGRGVVVVLNTASRGRLLNCAAGETVDGAAVAQILDRLHVSMTTREPLPRVARRVVDVPADARLALVGS